MIQQRSKELKTTKTLVLTWLSLVVFAALDQAQETSGPTRANVVSEEYATEIQPILATHCFGCHGQDEQNAMLRLDTLDSNFRGASAETWHDVLNQLNLGEMPPDDQPVLSSAARQKLTGWIRSNLDRVAIERKGTRNQTVLRRLTRYEYDNTMRDLLGLDLDFARDLPPEPSSSDGFKNNGASLGISSLQVEYYLEAARYALDKAIVEGPAPKVYRHRFEKTSSGKTPNDPLIGSRMVPKGRFLAKVLEYPREGEFVIRARVSASVPEGMGFPRMRVALGLKSDTESPARVVGEADVSNPESEPALYEFRGRIEEFPLPGHNPKFPGITITVTNVYEDGLPSPKSRKYKAIPLTAQQKKDVSQAVADHSPKLPLSTEEIRGKKEWTQTVAAITKLQRQLEEIRRIPPDHPNQTDLAYRLYDIDQAMVNEPRRLQTLAKMLGEDGDEFWERYRTINAAHFAERDQILDRFHGIPKINRQTKQFVEDEPEQPQRSTLVLESLDFEGPLYATWPPAHHTRLLPPSDAPERERAEQAISSLMTRAYRRPISSEDVLPVLSIYDEIRPTSPSFEEAMRETLAMVLISPEFLYLVVPNDDTSRPLTEHELASRLSYFLWSTMPDEPLRALADAGQLKDKELLEKQVRRMIDDPRSKAFVEHFTHQWLDLSGLDRVAINPNDYPDFDERLKPMMKQETHAFFAEILRNDRTALNLIDSEFLMLNEPLAKHYGIANSDGSPKGGEFEWVQLQPEDPRGGLLTQASFLMINSTGEDSHPIRRAVWVLDRLLGDPPAPPPPDVPELNSEQPDFASLSLKQQLELHRTKSACRDCHRGIDPWGIPFEGFDAVGLKRSFINRRIDRKTTQVPIDDEAVLPRGTKIDGVEDFKRYLLENETDRFSRSLVTKLMAYSLGRSLVLEDRLTIESLVKTFQAQDYRLSDLIVAIVQSEAFQTK
jgi:mono/diheme cytochrome c family protein